jgi:hypothetical protein
MTKLDALPVVAEVQLQTLRLYSPALEWEILLRNPQAPYCNLPSECAQKRRLEIQTLLASADPRDVASVHATEAFDSLPSDPEEPNWRERMFGSGSIDILAYEYVLISERQIERMIAGGQALREAKAAEEWKQAEAHRDYVALLEKDVIQDFKSDSLSIVDYQAAIPRSQTMKDESDAAIAHAQRAAQIDERYSDKLAEFKTTIEAYYTAADAIRRQAEDALRPKPHPPMYIPNSRFE